MVPLSSRQPLTLHQLGSSSGETPDNSVPTSDTTDPFMVLQHSSAGTLFSWLFTFLFLNLSLSELLQGLLERYLGIAPVLPNKCISLHLQMKPQNEVNSEKQQQQTTFVCFFFFNLPALLLACPFPLWPPVPSVSFWPLESHPFDFDIMSPFCGGNSGYSSCSGMRWSLS